MTERLKVVVIDDDEQFSKRVQAQIDGCMPDANVSHIDPRGLETLLDILHSRREAARAKAQANAEPCPIDDVDVVVIDFDLALLPHSTAADGEMLAYLCRVYSSAGLIIGLNQFGENSFDLTLAKGAMSFADMNVGVDQIDRPYLWTETRGDGLAAWSWSSIPEAVEALRGREEWISTRLDTPFHAPFETLFSYAMPREVESELGDKYKGTWRDWASSKPCLKRKDEAAGPKDLARIAAARVSHWLERVVLPYQDLIVDAPHLVGRYPMLLRNPAAADDWNATCQRGRMPDSLDWKALTASVFPNWELWLSRPVWLWAAVREGARGQKWEALPEGIATVAFCEDTSDFAPESEAVPFLCGLRTPFAQRYVRRVQGITYQPTVRFLSGQSAGA
jgi:hypothetical protein